MKISVIKLVYYRCTFCKTYLLNIIIQYTLKLICLGHSHACIMISGVRS